MKILITGGHVTPALAVIEELKKRPGIQIIFVGRKYALDGENTLSFEYQEIVRRNIPFVDLRTGRINRFLSLETIEALLRIPFGFIHAISILRLKKPDLILSFGGYLALPIAFAGFFYHIPLYTHEQTIVPGLANRVISFFSKQIFISFKDTSSYFPAHKVVLTGNPLRNSIFEVRTQPFNISKTKPVLLVTGGSLGSHALNMLIKPILLTLLKKYIVVHQTGDTAEFNDYLVLQDFCRTLPKDLQRNYFLKKHISEDEIGFVFHLSDLVISRAGANTFFELVALEKPAVLIPLPISASGEQQKHADLFQKAGAGKVFSQEEGSEKLLSLIEAMVSSLKSYKKNSSTLRPLIHNEAAKTITTCLLGPP